jgi:SnoaL-like domain
MDHTLTRMNEETSAPTPQLSVGGLLIEALARQDFTALAGCLDPNVRMRALLPRGAIEVVGSDQVAGWLRSLFGGPDRLEVADGTVGGIGPRLYLRWRVSLTPAGAGRRRQVEQHVFATTATSGQISVLDLLCSGFVAAPDTAGGHPEGTS